MRNAIVRLNGANSVDIITPVVNAAKVKGVLQDVTDEAWNAAAADVLKACVARGERVSIVDMASIPARDQRLGWAKRVVT